MIEVFSIGFNFAGELIFTWVMINGSGNIIVSTEETFPCRDSAAASARRYRAAFFAGAALIDERCCSRV